MRVMVLGFIGIGMAAGLAAAGLTLWFGGGVWLALGAYSLAGAAGTLVIGVLYAFRERRERRLDAPYMRAERV